MVAVNTKLYASKQPLLNAPEIKATYLSW